MIDGLKYGTRKWLTRAVKARRVRRSKHRDIFYSKGDDAGFLSSLRKDFPEAVEPAKRYLHELDRDENRRMALFIAPMQRDGRVESFHHFLGALLYPIILHEAEFGFEPGRILHVQDCGNLNRHLDAIARHIGVEIRYFPAEIASSLFLANRDRVLWLPPFDDSKQSDKWLHKHEIETLRKFGREFSRGFQEPKIPVLIISRGESDSVFASKRFRRLYFSYGDWNRTGASRRHVPNETELVDTIQGVAQTIVVSLEDIRLSEQIDLFRRAEIVIGQHGAGLNGLIWCEPGASVLELLPRSMLGSGDTYFRNIANKVGVQHTFMIQGGSHQPIDAKAIARYVARRRQTR